MPPRQSANYAKPATRDKVPPVQTMAFGETCHDGQNDTKYKMRGNVLTVTIFHKEGQPEELCHHIYIQILIEIIIVNAFITFCTNL